MRYVCLGYMDAPAWESLPLAERGAFRDECRGYAELLAEETSQLRRAGFSGRALIHPAQVAPIARGFAPSDAELEWARKVVEAADAAAAEGAGVTVVDGGMVDAPVVATARHLLQRAAD